MACGEMGNIEYKECYGFDGITWEPLPSLHKDHYPIAYRTKSCFQDRIGLWVGGGDRFGGMANELFNPEGQWITLPLDSPYKFNYPDPCVMPLNSTHLFFSGGTTYNGYSVLDTWILDLENLEWTPSTPMFEPRWRHGCVLTYAGEVIVAGGWNGNFSGYGISSVQIFNPVTMEWRESGNLPSEINTDAPGLLLWNDKVILLDAESDRIWLMEEDQGWRLMDVTMGAEFVGGYFDNAVLVSDSWRAGCTKNP